MKVLIAGATGLVGNHLLNKLIDDDKFIEITILVRKLNEIVSPKVNQIVFDFDKDSEYTNLPAYDAIFCCLGTTIKKAKSKENFIKVDFEYPKKLGELIKTPKFLLVSSMGANKNSSILYTKTKGRIEAALEAMNFESLHIFRPSQLSGKRNENRFGENVSEKVLRFLNFAIPNNYKLIAGKTVAEAMKIKSLSHYKGNHIYLSGEITQIVTHELES